MTAAVLPFRSRLDVAAKRFARRAGRALEHVGPFSDEDWEQIFREANQGSPLPAAAIQAAEGLRAKGIDPEELCRELRAILLAKRIVDAAEDGP